MIFMKKETEKVIEEISENKKVKGYVFKKLLLLLLSSALLFGVAFRLFEDFVDIEEIFIGICIIIYAVWCLIESFVGMVKMGTLNKEEENKK